MCFESDDAVVASFRRLWSRALVDATQAHVPEPDAQVTAIAGSDEEVQHALARDVTVAAIEARSHELWTVHAAGLADPSTGAVVALVAPSGTGKSTAAQHLGRRWAYLSDETVGIDAEGRVFAHPKPVSVVVEGTYLKRQVSPDEAGLVETSGDLHLGAVVLLERDGRDVPLVEELPRAHAVALVARETSYLARLPRPLHYLDRALSRAAGVWRVTYGDLDGLEQAVESLLSRSSESPRPSDEAPIEGSAGGVSGPGVGDDDPVELDAEQVVAAPSLDVLDVEGERLILIGERVVLLSPVAAAIHRHLTAGGPMTRSELLASLARELDLPDQPDEALGRLLEQLAGEAVVVTGDAADPE